MNTVEKKREEESKERDKSVKMPPEEIRGESTIQKEEVRKEAHREKRASKPKVTTQKCQEKYIIEREARGYWVDRESHRVDRRQFRVNTATC